MLPGDPLRARFIAETFFDEPTEVTAVRNMLGYTGSYEGMAVSVLGTGMGIPSASIYITELIQSYGAGRLVRVGSCGAVLDDLSVRDTVLAIGACTDSGTNRTRYGGWDYAATADYELLSSAALAASEAGLAVRVGNVHSSDLFYNPTPDAVDVFRKMGVLAIEMEAAGLYAVAAQEGARALAVLTVSDHVVSGESTSSDERERSFPDMVRVALDALLRDQERAA